MLAVLLPALLTGLATTIGAFPFLFMRGVARRTYDTLLGFGAGLMLAAATLGLLSAALEDVRQAGELQPARLALVLAGFAAGAALLRIMDGFIPHEHAGGHHEHVQGEKHGDDHGHGDGRGRGHDHGDDHDHGHGGVRSVTGGISGDGRG
jgi:zinc transporter ZupT